MKRKNVFLKAGILLLFVLLLQGILGCGAISNLMATPTPTATLTFTPTLTPTPSPTPTITPTPSFTDIIATMKPVTKGHGVPAAAECNDNLDSYRAVVVDETGASHEWNDALPTSWRPTSINETMFVILIEEDDRFIDSKPYYYLSGPLKGTFAGNVDRYRLDVIISVREANTGLTTWTAELQGSEPSFPEILPENTTRLTGSPVTAENFTAWISMTAPLFCRGIVLSTNQVSSLAFSPDGQTLAADEFRNIVIMRTSDGVLLRTLKGHTDLVNSMSFSPDGQFLTSGASDTTVRLWQVDSGKLLRTLEGHTARVYSVAFSSDGQVIASGSLDKTVRLWEVSSGKLMQTLEHEDVVDCVAFSPDGKIIASGTLGGNLQLWRVEDGTLLHILIKGQKNSAILSVAFSPDGQIIASASIDDTVRLWDVSSGRLLRTLEGHTSSVVSVSFSPDGRFMASGSLFDRTIRLWNVSDGINVDTLEFTSFVDIVSYSPDGRTLAVGTWDFLYLLSLP